MTLCKHALTAGLLAALASTAAPSIGSGPTVTAPDGVGLFFANGAQSTPYISVRSAGFILEYNAVGVPHYYPLSGGVWRTTMRVTFSSAGWSSATSGTGFGFQARNYSMNSGGLSSLTEWFAQPTVNALHVSFDQSTLQWQGNTNPSQVGYRWFLLSEFAVDPNDTTGKTGIKTWNSTASAPYPWAALPAQKDYTNTDNSWVYYAWLFPNPSASGYAWNPPALPSYPIEAVLEPSLQTYVSHRWPFLARRSGR